MKKILGIYFRGTNQKTQERYPYLSTIPQMEKKIYLLLDSLINIISSLQIIYLNEHPQALHLDKN